MKLRSPSSAGPALSGVALPVIVALLACALSACSSLPIMPGGTSSNAPASPRPAGPAKAAVPVVNTDPNLSQTLLGKQPQDLVALLGNPGLVRREKGVEVWQYEGGSCVLLFYLYGDGSGAHHVTYLEAMPQGGLNVATSGVTAQTCLADQLQARAAGQKPTS